MLDLLELFGVDRPGVQELAVPILALAHAVDLGLEPRHLRVEVLDSDRQRSEPVTGCAVLGLHLLVVLLLGEVGHPVRRAGQLGIDLGHLQQRSLLCHFSFHGLPFAG